jgi:integrase
MLATLTGLEPATFAVTGRRANQLRHRALLLLRVTASHVPPTGFEPALPP